jgi:hypothetical protein
MKANAGLEIGIRQPILPFNLNTEFSFFSGFHFGLNKNILFNEYFSERLPGSGLTFFANAEIYSSVDMVPNYDNILSFREFGGGYGFFWTLSSGEEFSITTKINIGTYEMQANIARCIDENCIDSNEKHSDGVFYMGLQSQYKWNSLFTNFTFNPAIDISIMAPMPPNSTFIPYNWLSICFKFNLAFKSQHQ